MKYCLAIFVSLILLFSCKEQKGKDRITAQLIVDESINACGGGNYLNHDVSYTFRDKRYESMNIKGKKVLKRITQTDSLTITDVKEGTTFRRYFNGEPQELHDTLISRYANGVNSVHYFSRLPFGLNDVAVKKKLLGEEIIKGIPFYKVQVTFSEENGGDDFEDTYLYWFDKASFKPTYLAYKFFTNGGGIRFRESYNERNVQGIRFVDYRNYKPKKGEEVDFFNVAALFETGQLELLSTIALEDIQVFPSED